jgi:hypothetical protein
LTFELEPATKKAKVEGTDGKGTVSIFSAPFDFSIREVRFVEVFKLFLR